MTVPASRYARDLMPQVYSSTASKDSTTAMFTRSAEPARQSRGVQHWGVARMSCIRIHKFTLNVAKTVSSRSLGCQAAAQGIDGSWPIGSPTALKRKA